MRIDRVVAVLIFVGMVSLAFVDGARAQSLDEFKTFFLAKYVGMSLKVDATNETVPERNATLRLWVNCTSSDVFIESFNMTMYGFRFSGPEEAVLYSAFVASNTPLAFNEIIEQNHTVLIPSDVYGPLFCKLDIRYAIIDQPMVQNPEFAITSVKNIYYEDLKAAFQQLNDTYWQLNQTYLELKENYTNLQKSMIEINNTRMLASVFLVTTVFFVATTLYLTLRRPKESW